MLSHALQTWRRSLTRTALCHLAFGTAIGGVLFGATVAGLTTSVGLLVIFPLAVPVIWLLLGFAHLAAGIERSRVAALLGADMVDPVPAPSEPTFLRRLLGRVRSAARWREIAYLVLGFPVRLLAGVVAVASRSGSAALAALPLYVVAPAGRLGAGVVDAHRPRPRGPRRRRGRGPRVGACRSVDHRATAAFDRRIAEWLISTDRTERLEEKVTSSNHGTVDDAVRTDPASTRRITAHTSSGNVTVRYG